MTTTTVLTQSERRLEGDAKVTGEARYAGDFRIEGVLHVAFARSPYPHALINGVDTRPALELPGVHRVFVGEDLRPKRLGRRLQDWPILAWDRVRLVGDRVAAVVADTPSAARKAAAAILVEFEELEGVFDLDSALRGDAPVLHPDAKDYSYLGDKRPDIPHPNVQGRLVHKHGDPESAMGNSYRVFEHTFETAAVFPAHLEPRAAVAWVDGSRYHVVSTNKSPYQLRKQLAASLDLDADDIVVDSGYIGGDFGGKGLSIDEFALLPIAAEMTRPVMSVERYEEDMTASSLRHGSRITLRTGVGADGRIVAHEAVILLNGGAYAAAKPSASLLPGDALASLAGYQVPTARVDAMTVYTNTAPAGNARAPGQPQNAFAAESHVEMIAREMGIGPLEFRVLNALRAGDVDVHGDICRDASVPVVLDALGARVDLTTPLPSGIGRGIAIGARPSPVGDLEARVGVRVTPRADVVLTTPISDQGGGAHTALQRIVAAELGVALDVVRVERVATDRAPFDAGIGGGRVTPVVGGAALEGARALRQRLDELEPGKSTVEQLLRAAEVGVEVEGNFKHREGVNTSCAYYVEVSVDRETGVIELSDCVLVADVCTVINPIAARGQLIGGFAFGLGQTLMEEMILEEGTPITSNLADYKIPTMPDVPPVQLVLVDGTPGDGPFGAKSIGELSNPAIGPAIANAVFDAVGVRLMSLPLTAEKVRSSIDSQDRAHG